MYLDFLPVASWVKVIWTVGEKHSQGDSRGTELLILGCETKITAISLFARCVLKVRRSHVCLQASNWTRVSETQRAKR